MIGLYVGLIVVGGYIMWSRIYCTALQRNEVEFQGAVWTFPLVRYVAALNLPAQHRIRLSDVVIPEKLPPELTVGLPPRESLLGLYTPRGINKGQVILHEELLRRPQVLVSPGSAIATLSLPTEGNLAELLDVGWNVDVCDDSECPILDRKVLAVDCLGRSTTDHCFVVLELTDHEQTKVHTFSKKGLLKVVVNRMTLDGG
jgi:hypothetical protein